jgi:hypothetical protein
VEAFGVLIKFKMADVAMVTKVEQLLIFFSMLAVSMATAAILKKLTLKGKTSHGI